MMTTMSWISGLKELSDGCKDVLFMALGGIVLSYCLVDTWNRSLLGNFVALSLCTLGYPNYRVLRYTRSYNILCRIRTVNFKKYVS